MSLNFVEECNKEKSFDFFHAGQFELVNLRWQMKLRK